MLSAQGGKGKHSGRLRVKSRCDQLHGGQHQCTIHSQIIQVYALTPTYMKTQWNEENNSFLDSVQFKTQDSQNYRLCIIILQNLQFNDDELETMGNTGQTQKQCAEKIYPKFNHLKSSDNVWK